MAETWLGEGSLQWVNLSYRSLVLPSDILSLDLVEGEVGFTLQKYFSNSQKEVRLLREVGNK